jgi:hypothetical protein
MQSYAEIRLGVRSLACFCLWSSDMKGNTTREVKSPSLKCCALLMLLAHGTVQDVGLGALR